MRNKSGITILELLTALLLVGIIFLPIVEMVNRAFISEFKNRINVEAKENRDLSLGRVSSNLKGASYIYSSTSQMVLPTDIGTYQMTPGTDGIAALVPVYDDNGEVVRDGDDSQFDAYAYALVPANQYYENTSSTDKVLIETYNRFYCAAPEDDPSHPTTNCETDWTSSGESNVIFEDAKPGVFLNYTSPFVLSGSDVIKVVFAANKGQIYYPATSGVDVNSKFVHSTDIFCRNAE